VIDDAADHAPSLEEMDRFLAASLWPGEGQSFDTFAWSEDTSALAERIRFHGIALALGEAKHAMRGWPASLREEIRAEGRLQGIWESSHHAMMAKVLGQLAEAGVDALVMKGTALAYAFYDDPAIRKRGDSDVLVRRSQLDTARLALRDAGLVPHGDYHFGQETWRQQRGKGFVHYVDLHWEVTGPPSLRHMLDVEECFEHAVALPRLAPSARMIEPVQALLRGAINQALHGVHGYFEGAEKLFEESRLIWHYDAHLLAGSFDEADWQRLVDLATSRGLAPMVAKLLAGAQQTCGTEIPVDVVARLEASDAASRFTEYLAKKGAMGRMVMDLRAARGGRDVRELLSLHLLPSPEHMRQRFPEKQDWPHALLHAYRLVAGALSRIGLRLP
jgi:hypothetical protein